MHDAVATDDELIRHAARSVGVVEVGVSRMGSMVGLVRRMAHCAVVGCRGVLVPGV